MQIHQVMVTAAPGDAVTGMALHTRKLLRRICPSEIYARYLHPDLTGVRPLSDLPSAGADRVLIYQSSIGDPEVTTLLERTDDPLILIYHNITPSHFFTRWDHRIEHIVEWGRQELELIRPRVVRAIADSAFNARELHELGYDAVTVLPLGVDPTRLLRLPSPRRGMPRLDGTVILAVSQIMPHKRIDLLAETAYVLEHHLRANANLLVVGASRLRAYDRALLELVRQLSLHRFHLLGAVGDQVLAELYRSAGAFVTVSEHEGLCVPPLEAMAFGVPVVARRYGAVSDTLGGAALMLEPGSGPTAVAEALAEVIDNRPLVQSLTQRGTELTARWAERPTDREFLDVVEAVL
jgi:glycosyltransferase involved in cell wall biosynthesis